MAEKWYNDEFTPHFSGAVLVFLVALLVFAYFSGKRSVRVRPRRKGLRRHDDQPRLNATKVQKYRTDYARGLSRNRTVADSVIVFCSKTRDYLWSTVAAFAFLHCFCANHWNGLVQWVINGLAAQEAAIWGDLLALMVVSMLSTGVGCAFYFLRHLGEWVQAHRLVENYLYKLHKRPIMVETPNLLFILKALVWVIKEERETKEEAKSETICIRQTKRSRNTYSAIAASSIAFQEEHAI